MKRLWVVAALAPLSFAAECAHAQTDVSGNTPVYTATANNGQPSDVVVTGGMNPASGVAVTLNSNNNVTNESSIVIQNATSPSAGIQAIGGNTGSISNTGNIEIDESTNYQDTNGDGVDDSNNGVLGQYAAGSNRYGIQVIGSGPLIGSISNTGTISVIGENSAAIYIGAGGLQGSLTNAGSISAIGGNAGTSDITYGIQSLGLITGSVNLNTDSITATGANAQAVNLSGGVGGSVEISTTLTSTGYRATTASTNPQELAKIYTQQSSELLQGGTTLTVAGAGGGLSLDAPAAATSTVSATTGAVITSYGEAPAVALGGSSASTFGLYGTTQYGVLIGGTVVGVGDYDRDSNGNPVSATAMTIGLGGGPVTIDGGLDISGTVSATAIADISVNNLVAGATGLDIQNTNAPLIQIEPGGVLTASARATEPTTVTALLLGSGSNVASLNNYGSISAVVTGVPGYLNVSQSAGGTQGYATAISDQSGSLTSIHNYATIAATVTPIVDLGVVEPTSTRTIAIDLSANTTGATITQSQDPGLVYSTYNAATGVTTITSVPTVYGVNQTVPGSTTTEVVTTPTTLTGTAGQFGVSPAAVVPVIAGDVLFGSGAGTLNLEAGSLIGGVSFGTSAGNALTISGGATETGALAEASGGSLALNISDGTLDITAPTANSLPSPTNLSPGEATLGASNVNVGSAGVLAFTVNTPSAGNTTAENAVITGPQLNASGTVTFANGATLGLNFLSKLTQPTTYDIITAGTGQITIANLATVANDLPYLYAGSTTVTAYSPTQDAVAVSVAQKTAQQLGLNTAEAAALPAILNAFGLDSAVSAAMLSQTNKANFLHFYDQFLPDYEGGPFESIALGQRQLAKAEAESPVKMPDGETRGWVQEIGFLDNRDADSQANGYKAGGFGLAGGIEHSRGGGVFGLAAAFLTDGSKDASQGPGGTTSTSAIELGVYWRTSGDGLNAHADLNGGYAYMDSNRLVYDETSTGLVSLYRLAKSQWNAAVASADLGLSYQMQLGRFYLRPELAADYAMLYEGAHSEEGGGDAIDLSIASRLNQQATVDADMVFGARFGDAVIWEPEMTIGWREVIFGGPADTTATFVSGGPTFTLSPAFEDHGGLLARLGLHAGGAYADFSADAGGEYRNSYQSYDARAVARFLF